MLKIFNDNLWLAEPETLQWYQDLTAFVEIWRRWLKKTIPPDVAEKLNHQQVAEKLEPFYRHIEKHVTVLRDELQQKDKPRRFGFLRRRPRQAREVADPTER